MNPKNYTTIETSKRLKELGVLQRSDACWQTFRNVPEKVLITYVDGLSGEMYSAFNASELGEMMPEHLYTAKIDDKFELEKGRWKCISTRIGSALTRYADTEVEARAKTLVDYITTLPEQLEHINSRYTQYLEG